MRGDDSYFYFNEEPAEEAEKKETIEIINEQGEKEIKEIEVEIGEEEDLYDETKILEDEMATEEEAEEKAIKTDNILGVAIGYIDSLNKNNETTRYQQIMGMWAHRPVSDFWIGDLVLKSSN